MSTGRCANRLCDEPRIPRGMLVRVCDVCGAPHHNQGNRACWNASPRGCKFCGTLDGASLPLGDDHADVDWTPPPCPHPDANPDRGSRLCSGRECQHFELSDFQPSCTLPDLLPPEPAPAPTTETGASDAGDSRPKPASRGPATRDYTEADKTLDEIRDSVKAMGETLAGIQASLSAQEARQDELAKAIEGPSPGGEGVSGEILAQVQETSRLLAKALSVTGGVGGGGGGESAARSRDLLWAGVKRLGAGLGSAAERDFQAARDLNLDPERDHLLLNAIGAARLAASDPKEAEGILREALAANGDSAAANGNLGVALAHQGRWDEAKEHLVAACRLDPGDARHRANLGYVEYARGDVVRARESWLEARKLDAWSDAARESLEQICGGAGEIGEGADPLAPLDEIREAMPD